MPGMLSAFRLFYGHKRCRCQQLYNPCRNELTARLPASAAPTAAAVIFRLAPVVNAWFSDKPLLVTIPLPSYYFSMQTRDQGKRGMQFEVTADDKYVYKTLHSVEKSAAIYKSYGYGLVNRDLNKLAANVLDHAKRSLEGVRIMLKRHPELASTFANPVILDDLSYRQDKVTVMGAVLHQTTRAEGRKLIDEYIDLLLFHARYGVADPMMQMGTNYGVDKDGKVVLIDIGELVFDKEAAVTAARTKAWKKADTYYSPFKRLHNKFIIPVMLKPYYRQQMLARFTPEAIEANWLKAIKSDS